MITEFLLLSPSGEIRYDQEEIRRYAEHHYADRWRCPRCGCYLIPTEQTHRLLLCVYRCVNSVCSTSLKTFRFWPLLLLRVA